MKINTFWKIIHMKNDFILNKRSKKYIACKNKILVFSFKIWFSIFCNSGNPGIMP